MYRKIGRICRKNNLEVCLFTNRQDGNDDLKILSREQAIVTFLEDNCIPSSMWTKLVISSIFSKLKFNSHIECGEDVLMTWQLLNFITHIGVISAKFYNYRNNPSSITSGPFSDAIYSMHLVWDRIVEDCVHQYPKLERLAKQKLLQCYEGLLCSAIRSKTNLDHRINNIRHNIHDNIDLLFTKDKSIKYITFILLSVYFYDITRAMFSRHIRHINTIR